MTVAAILVAGGLGARMGEAVPKQYLKVGGRTILERSISLFLTHTGVDIVQVVIGTADQERYARATANLDTPRLAPPVTGGDSRSASVVAGLDALAMDPPDRVLIHDAARPFCPKDVISAVINALDTADGAFAALDVVDALWRRDGAHASEPVSREGLVRAQTPQGFVYDKIVTAYRDHGAEAADDVAIARAAGLRVEIVPSVEANFKITTPADLVRAERYIETRHAAPA